MDWLPIARKEGFVGQTQTCYADAHGVYVFNHPIDFHYIADSVASWPQLHLQVFKLDAAGRVETLAYGSMTLPNACGHREVTVRTWRPLQRNVLEEVRGTAHVGVGGCVCVCNPWNHRDPFGLF
ncbi:B9 domain-containing protein 2 [Durusdinium trenchii]|uniref:B9 domain-containing protein 2 n=1 Tax=Durusdinium trenchii TaxID=1381693 RepID=A0ABP0S8F4_9DINO